MRNRVSIVTVVARREVAGGGLWKVVADDDRRAPVGL